MNEHEVEFAKHFIEKNKRERVSLLLDNPKRRRDFVRSLSHFHDLDPRFAKSIPSGTAHTVEEWLRLLKSKGAPETCWAISENVTLDAKLIPLEVALRETWGMGMGTILSCIPGRLCYFEDEDGQRLLER